MVRESIDITVCIARFCSDNVDKFIGVHIPDAPLTISLVSKNDPVQDILKRIEYDFCDNARTEGLHGYLAAEFQSIQRQRPTARRWVRFPTRGADGQKE